MFTVREQELYNALDVVCKANNVKIVLNPVFTEDFKLDTTISLDVEHDESGNFVGCGIYCLSRSTVYYFSDLYALLSVDFQSVALVCHNGRSDFECLRQWGINVTDNQLLWDTELVAHILDSSRKGYGLKKLSKDDLDIIYPSYDDIVGKRTLKQTHPRRTLDQWPVEIVSRYNALDCYVTWQLYKQQQKGYIKCNYFVQIERPVSFILQQIENRGICVDLMYLQGLKRTLEAQKEPIEALIKNELGDINLNSPRQLLEALNAKEIYPTFKGKASTDKRAFASFSSDPIIKKLLAYSEIDTLLSSFILPYLKRGQIIVHPWFNQCGTRTGRLSCSNPNLLQIPRRTENGKLVRRMFIPRPGMLMGDCDFGQIEPRIMAHLSKDPVLCQMFNDGVDFHTFTAERLYISRERAKVLNLSVGYRATFKSVMAQLGVDRYEAQEQIDKWWDLFPSLRRWQNTLIYEAKRSGFCITLLGRRIRVDGLSEGNSWKREHSERQLINNLVQGSAAEVMKLAMIGIEKAQRMACFHPTFGLLVQVYDELLFESQDIEEDLKGVRHSMENAIKLDVPLTADGGTGANWDACKPE